MAASLRVMVTFMREVTSVMSLSVDAMVHWAAGQLVFVMIYWGVFGIVAPGAKVTRIIESEHTWRRKVPVFIASVTPSDCFSTETTGFNGFHCARACGAIADAQIRKLLARIARSFVIVFSGSRDEQVYGNVNAAQNFVTPVWQCQRVFVIGSIDGFNLVLGRLGRSHCEI